jgi:hypothetical protein
VQFWLGKYFFNMTYEDGRLTNILFGFGYDECKPVCFGARWVESDAKVEQSACVNTFRDLLSVSASGIA